MLNVAGGALQIESAPISAGACGGARDGDQEDMADIAVSLAGKNGPSVKSNWNNLSSWPSVVEQYRAVALPLQ